MAKKNGIFSLIVRGAVIFTFLFLEREMFREYEQIKKGVDGKRDAMFKEITGLFARREENFYLNKEYLKADFEFKERKRIEAEERRKAEIARILEYRRLQAEKLLKEQELKNQESNLNSEELNKQNTSNLDNKKINGEELNKSNLNSQETEKNINKDNKTGNIIEKSNIKTEDKKENKPPKKIISKGAVKVRVTKPTRIEDVTEVPKEVRPITIHRVETNVYRLSDDDDEKNKKTEKTQNSQTKEDKKETQKLTPIKKEKNSSFKEIEILGN